MINVFLTSWGDCVNEMDLVEVGQRIQSRRRQMGLTQEQLADKMNVSKQMASNLEWGNKAIRIDNLGALSRTLNVSTDYILTGKETTDDLQALTARIASLSEKDRKMLEILIAYCAAK